MTVRVYADTSVFGGVFDTEFEEPSREFFRQVVTGRFELITSAIVAEEIASAPVTVRDWFEEYLTVATVVGLDQRAVALKNAYLKAGIVGPKWETDAQHVALASAAGCRLIVSWNFKHIVHFEKIPLYNGVNLINGFDSISINSPSEVIEYEEQTV